jgi:hypothetical protein
MPDIPPEFLAKRSCSIVTRDATGSHKMQHFMARQPNLGGKNFGKSTCALCTRERMEIFKLSRTIPDQIIN